MRVVGLLAITLISLIIWCKRGLSEREEFLAEMDLVRVIMPDTRPEVSNESIALAMVAFGIQRGPLVRFPVLDGGLAARGEASYSSVHAEIDIRIGPAAFESWGILGSTLAHEIEVHGTQPIALVRALDFLGFGATSYFEFVAYKSERIGRERFGLTPNDLELIDYYIDFFQSNEPTIGGSLRRKVLNFLAPVRVDALSSRGSGL